MSWKVRHCNQGVVVPIEPRRALYSYHELIYLHVGGTTQNLNPYTKLTGISTIQPREPYGYGPVKLADSLANSV